MKKLLHRLKSVLIIVACLSALKGRTQVSGIISTIAGNGIMGSSGDGGPATNAELDLAQGVVKYYAGNLYITDQVNQRVRKVDAFTGIITTIAGNDTAGYSGDGGPATAAKIWDAYFMDFDRQGNLYFSENTNNVIRKVSPSGIISTVAGVAPYSWYYGDGIAATAAYLSNPVGLAINKATGAIYFCDNNNQRIRMIDTNGIIHTIAGDGIPNYNGDGIQATSAEIYDPTGLCIDGAGNLYFSDGGNARVREISTSGIITTIAGTGTDGYSGDGGPATAAMVHYVDGVAYDATSNRLYLAQTWNSVIRAVDLGTGIITTTAGDDTAGYSGDGVAATATRLNTPCGVDVDCSGNVYIADYNNFRIRYVHNNSNSNPAFAAGASTGFSACENTMSPINSLLGIYDADGGQQEWWVVLSGPAHGTLGGFDAQATAPSSSGVVTPAGLTYTPAAGFTGTDHFTIGIADCAGGTGSINVTVTVNPFPAPITGAAPVCPGGTETLSDFTAGGIWSSSPGTVVTIGSSGIVTGVAAGSASISYTVAGCAVTATVTVNPLPPSITGTTTVCAGSSAPLFCTTGGTWSSSNTAIAAINPSSGILAGNSTGTCTITYTLPTGCFTTAGVTVNPAVPSITGTLSICSGSAGALTDGAGGGAWTSNNTTVAAIGSLTGNVTAGTSGLALISYTITSGCYATAMITVNPVPGAISGGLGLCAGSATTLSVLSGSGGSWSSASTGIATIGSSSGLLTGVTAGTSVISYTFATGCGVSAVATVNTLPGAITGNVPVCTGASNTLGDATGGGTWTSGSTGIATIGSSTGVITGITAGNTTITYTLGTVGAGCYVTATATVNASPSAITGTMVVCVGNTTTLSDPTGGGTWASSSSATASVSSGGVVTGNAAGTATITYTASDGCYAVTTVTVQSPSAISVPGLVCAGTTMTVTDPVSGGTWSSSNTSVATVGSASGIVTGASGGTATITYTLTGGCFVTAIVTVNAPPAAITGQIYICPGGNVILNNTTGGGTWTSSNTGVATIDPVTGGVTGVATGTTVISYNAGGCYVTTTFTVVPTPTSITGTSPLCAGSSSTFTDGVPGGTWLSSNPSIASTGFFTGIITGLAGGTTTISYTLGSGCTATMPVTINAHPTPIYGAGAICVGAVDSFYDYTPGGVWSSSNSAIAPVSTTGMVSGLSGGLATITYTSSSTGCYATWAVSVLVIPAIAGLHNLCAWGDTMTISDADTGGLFSSTSVTVTNYGAGIGFVYSAAPGTAVIDYTLPLGCTVSDTITVNPLPGLITAVSGSLLDCAGTSVTLSDIPIGGTWTSGNTAVATIGSSSGVITPVSSGIARITYTSPVGCRADTVFLNNPTPDPINGANTFLCPGATITLYDTIPGGTWSSSNPAIATINTYSGVVSGITGGVVTITYTVCSHTVLATVTVSAIPAISGDTLICAGATIALTDGAGGGTWSSSNTAAGTIDPSGDITGISAGSTTITYMVTSSCYATLPVSVSGAVGSCGPCMVFHTYHRLSGLITSNVGPGNYSVTNNVTIQGNVTFDSAVIMVGPGDTIFVDTSSTLTVDSSHIFSLCSEWQGLWLKPGHTHSGKVFIKKHSLIEDALCGVYIPHAVPPASGNIFESQASVFNRNKVGIAIQFYNDTLANYPFLIHNTVITSRDFSAYPGYPGDWPATMGPRGLKTYLAPRDTFTAPFNVMSYTYAACYSSDPLYGIELDSVANYYVPTTPVGLILPDKYSGITIGDLTVTANDSNQNLIDEQKFGVWAINSNLTCENNAFTNMLPAQMSFIMPTGTISSPTGGDAIYAASTNDLTNPNKLWVSSPPSSTYDNLFYGFTNAIECSNYLQVLVRRMYAISAHTTYGSGMFLTGGQTGILIKTAKYDTIDIDHNTIFNTFTGISLNMSYDPTVWTTVYGRSSGGMGYVYSVATPSQYMDLCTINNNLLQAQPDRSASFSNVQMNLGISYQNPIIFHPTLTAGGTTVVTYAHDLDMYDNTIQDAYSGIFVNNYAAARYNPYITLNTIALRQPSSTTQLSYGINNTICNNSLLYQNTIFGAQPSAATADNMRAVYMNNNTTDAVACNVETQLGRGFEFYMNNLPTSWRGNTMSNNLKGFVLNGGVIGPQYDVITPGVPSSDNDAWAGSWGGTNYQTYVNNANPVSSALWSLPGAKPTVNGASISTHFAYGADTNSLRTASSPGSPCVYMPPPPNDVYLAEQMAEQHVNYVYNTVPANWIAQYALWKATVFDTAIVDSSAVIQQFQHMADSMGRFRYLTNIETALNDGNLSLANGLLSANIDLITNTAYDSATGVRMADDSATDFIVQNYQQFYRLYIRYETGVFSTEDSTQLFALSQLCPEVNGTVVYQARALYSGIFNDYSMYNDDSCMNADSTYIGERHSETGTQNEQEYMLWPNPNNGSISLGQMTPDSKPVKAEIWNEVGMEVYRDNLQFNGGRDQLHMMNVAPGLYLLRLTDSKNRVFTLKFVVQ